MKENKKKMTRSEVIVIVTAVILEVDIVRLPRTQCKFLLK